MSYKLIAISGSLRKDSFNTKLMKAFIERAPSGVSFEIINIGEFPLFNQDLEANMPESVVKAKEAIKAADGVMIFTPEYNRTVPGPLKNAIDWISRPYGTSAWDKKPVFIAGASEGGIGGALGAVNVKQAFEFLNAYMIGQPEFYLSGMTKKFDEAGNLTDEDTQKRVDQVFTAFLAFIDKVR